MNDNKSFVDRWSAVISSADELEPSDTPPLTPCPSCSYAVSVSPEVRYVQDSIDETIEPRELV